MLLGGNLEGNGGNCVKVGAVLGDVCAVFGHVGSGLSGFGAFFSHIGALSAAVSAV